MVIMHVWCFGLMVHSGEITGKIYVGLFLPVCVFLFSRNLLERFWGQVLWHLWNGRARKPLPGLQHVAVEVFNVESWLTPGDFALGAQVDFLAVVEHRLIPARMRGEWAGLRGKGVEKAYALLRGFLFTQQCGPEAICERHVQVVVDLGIPHCSGKLHRCS